MKHSNDNPYVLSNGAKINLKTMEDVLLADLTKIGVQFNNQENRMVDEKEKNETSFLLSQVVRWCIFLKNEKNVPDLKYTDWKQTVLDTKTSLFGTVLKITVQRK